MNPSQTSTNLIAAAKESELSIRTLRPLIDTPQHCALLTTAILLIALLWFSNRITERFLRAFKFFREQPKSTSNLVIWIIKGGTIILVTGIFRNIVILSPDKITFVDDLAILGTILAIVAWRESVQQNDEINDIANSLPTRYLDSFPNHLQDIIRLINTTNFSLHILADCADYGSFSHPTAHDEVLQAITNAKNRKVDIKIRICGEIQPLSRSSEFWEPWLDSEHDLKAWRELCLKPKFFWSRLEVFRHHNPDLFPQPIDALTYDRNDFKAVMETKHENVMRYLRDNLKIPVRQHKNIAHMPGVFFWMKDAKEAVFLLSHSGTGTQGMAFFTRDTKIIQILNNIWKSTRTEACKGAKRALDFRRVPSIVNFLRLVPNAKRKQINRLLAEPSNKPTH